jgi:hypothetical protein
MTKKLLVFNAVALLLIALLYFITAPLSVQSGDTAELVTNSYFLRVAHPPGYPLFSLLYHLPIYYLGSGNPYYAASLFTILISCLWMGLLMYELKSLDASLLIILLATGMQFWRYALQPDVFALHMLFLVLVFMVFNQPGWLERPWMIFIIALAVANHHTIVFAFPLFVFALAQVNWRQKLIYCLVAGLAAASLYLVLLWFNPEHAGSWGNINSIPALVRHFLRADYGTFQLAEKKGDWRWLGFAWEVLLSNAWALLIVLGYIGLRCRQRLQLLQKKFLVLGLALVSYLLVFVLAGSIPLDLAGENVFERFLMQPLLWLFMFAWLGLGVPELKLPQWLRLLIVINLLMNISGNFKFNNYRINTSIEDYALNMLRLVPAGDVLYVYGDTEGFATYYLQATRQVRSDITYLMPTTSFPWSAAKARRDYPELILNDSGKILQMIDFSKASLFTNFAFTQIPVGIDIVFRGILYDLKLANSGGGGVSFDCPAAEFYQRRTPFTEEHFIKFEYSHLLHLKYGMCHFEQGIALLRQQQFETAQTLLQAAVDLAPFAPNYLERLCFTLNKSGDPAFRQCEQRLEQLLEHVSRQYYLYKY